MPLFLPQKKDKIGKKGCFFYGIFIIPHQRHQPRQRVRHHRARLHDGLRHRQNAELRPRRRHHGRRLHLVLRDVLSGTAQHRSRPARGRRLYGARHCDRASGLQAAALGAQPRGAYHRHRRELLPAKLRPADLEGRRACLSPRGRGNGEPFRRSALHLLHFAPDHRGLRRHHARVDHLRQQEQDGQGHACLLGG